MPKKHHEGRSAAQSSLQDSQYLVEMFYHWVNYVWTCWCFINTRFFLIMSYYNCWCFIKTRSLGKPKKRNHCSPEPCNHGRGPRKHPWKSPKIFSLVKWLDFFTRYVLKLSMIGSFSPGCSSCKWISQKVARRSQAQLHPTSRATGFLGICIFSLWIFMGNISMVSGGFS